MYWIVFQLEFAAVALLTWLISCDLCLQVDVYCLVAPFLPLLILHFECGWIIRDSQIIFRTEVDYNCAWWSSPSSHHGRSNVCCFDILMSFLWSIDFQFHWCALVTAVLLTCLLSALKLLCHQRSLIRQADCLGNIGRKLHIDLADCPRKLQSILCYESFKSYIYVMLTMHSLIWFRLWDW